MDIEGYISTAKMEIEQLQEDISHVRNNETIKAIEHAVDARKRTIKLIKEKYGCEECGKVFDGVLTDEPRWCKDCQ